MKRLLILSLLLFSLFLTACDKENESPVVTTDRFQPSKGSVGFISQFGVVEFNEKLQRWVIDFGDNIMTKNPNVVNCTAVPTTDLPDQYKKQGTELFADGSIEYSIDSISVITNQPVVKYSLTYRGLSPVPGPDNLWTDYDYIKIKLPDRVLFFSSNQMSMEPFGSYTSVNLPDIKVYGMGAGFNFKQQESLEVSIFDSITRIRNNVADVIKTGFLQYAKDAKSPGASFDWNFPNVRYYTTLGENDRPDCFFKIVRSEFVPGRLNRTYRIGATFRCVFKTTVNGGDARIMGEGQLVTKIDF